MILTLKDSAILDEEAMDTLENVNVVDQEKAEKNIIDIKKAKQAYNKFDVEDVDARSQLVRALAQGGGVDLEAGVLDGDLFQPRRRGVWRAKKPDC